MKTLGPSGLKGFDFSIISCTYSVNTYCAYHDCGSGQQGKIAIWELGCKVKIGLNLIEKQFCQDSLDFQINKKTILGKPLPSTLIKKKNLN